MPVYTAMPPLPSHPRAYHVPKLTYRNAAPQDTSPTPRKPSTSTAGTSGTESSTAVTESSSKVVDLSSMPRKPSHPMTESSASSRAPPSTTPPQSMTSSSGTSAQPNRKRASFFGGLFAREATSAALDQVAQQLVANHGELSARAVPGVSSSKMPDYVPKVNSKWDGIPESVKQKERQRKSSLQSVTERSNPGKRPPLFSRRSQSADRARAGRAAGQSVSPRRPGSSSTMSSFGSQSGVSEVYHTHYDNLSSSSSSESASTLEDAKSPKRPPWSVCSQSLRSPSGTSLPEISAFFPDDFPEPPVAPTKFKYDANLEPLTVKAEIPKRKASADISAQSSTPVPHMRAGPDHPSSPPASRGDGSPVTPFSAITSSTLQVAPDTMVTTIIHSKHEQVVLVAAGFNVLGAPATAKIGAKESKAPKPLAMSKPPGDPFLAGEAHLLELPESPAESISNRFVFITPEDQEPPLDPAVASSSHAPVHEPELATRPDSSRLRLGLRASVVKTDVVPWNWQDDAHDVGTGSAFDHSAGAGRRKSLPINPMGFFAKDKNDK